MANIPFFEESPPPDDFIKSLREKYLIKLNIKEDYILEKIEERKNAKSEKNFERADSIRTELEEKGIVLNDTANGTVWELKDLY